MLRILIFAAPTYGTASFNKTAMDGNGAAHSARTRARADSGNNFVKKYEFWGIIVLHFSGIDDKVIET